MWAYFESLRKEFLQNFTKLSCWSSHLHFLHKQEGMSRIVTPILYSPMQITAPAFPTETPHLPNHIPAKTPQTQVHINLTLHS